MTTSQIVTIGPKSQDNSQPQPVEAQKGPINSQQVAVDGSQNAISQNKIGDTSKVKEEAPNQNVPQQQNATDQTNINNPTQNLQANANPPTSEEVKQDLSQSTSSNQQKIDSIASKSQAPANQHQSQSQAQPQNQNNSDPVPIDMTTTQTVPIGSKSKAKFQGELFSIQRGLENL